MRQVRIAKRKKKKEKKKKRKEKGDEREGGFELPEKSKKYVNANANISKSDGYDSTLEFED